MRSKSLTISFCALLLWSFIVQLYGAIPASASLSYIIDQSSEDYNYDRQIEYYSPMGQVFTPTLSSLDFIELILQHGGGSSNASFALTRIRESTISGTILGTSETVFLEDCSDFPHGPDCGIVGSGEVIHFEFANTVSLTIGQPYVIEVVSLGPDYLMAGLSTNNPYADGLAIFNGGEDPSRDLWFREGVVVPIPGAVWLLGTGLIGLVGYRRMIIKKN